MRHVECSVCKEVHKSALTDVHELCYTISLYTLYFVKFHNRMFLKL